MPLVLGLQAVAYYIPGLIWRIFTYNRTGIDLKNLIKVAKNVDIKDVENRKKSIQHLASSLEVLLFNRREMKEFKDGLRTKIRQALPGKRHGNKLIYFYLLIKILYILIGMAQLCFTYVFLRLDQNEGYFFFGYRILNNIMAGKSWTETLIFPRMGICRHAVHVVSATQKVFAQCLLPINMVNEKIYIFLYFFLSGVVIITIFSIPLWLFRIAPFRQRHFVKRFFRMADLYDRNDCELKELIKRFIHEFLRQDGHFLLRMLSMNVGDITTMEIVQHLFNNYRENFIGRDLRGRVRQCQRGDECAELCPLNASGIPNGNKNELSSLRQQAPQQQ